MPMSGNLIRLLLALTLGASSTGAAPRPVPGDPDHKFLIIPGVAQVVLSFFHVPTRGEAGLRID